MSIGTMLFNPFTGEPRDPRDIASDPHGHLIHDGEEPLRAAKVPFKREPRYVVFKIADVQKYLSDEDRGELERIRHKLARARAFDCRLPFNAVVVEQDWPEFDYVWDMIEGRVKREQKG